MMGAGPHTPRAAWHALDARNAQAPATSLPLHRRTHMLGAAAAVAKAHDAEADARGGADGG